MKVFRALHSKKRNKEMKKLIVFAIVATILSIFNGCRKDDFMEVSPEIIVEQPPGFSEGKMFLGEKLNNPYSVESMSKAYKNLVERNELKSGVEIETTHYYVRFRPKNYQELDLITRDTTLDVYDYPLDVEIKRGGTHYHDPSIPANEITWQYTVVPVNYTFPDVQYQKLADLYLFDEENEYLEVKSGDINYLDWRTIEYEALKMTGNLKEQSEGPRTKGTSWRPSGTIRVFDDVVNSYSATRKVFDHYEYYNCETGERIDDPTQDPGDPNDPYLKSTERLDDPEIPTENICSRPVYRYETNTVNSHFIPLEGVEVRATSWFTTHKGYADANGNFTCDGTFSSDANYSIKWERWDFDIRDGLQFQAYYNGPKQTGQWNLDIERQYTPKSHQFAHIFRAAHTYYYKHDQWGIKAPPRRDGILGTLGHRLHIAGVPNGRSMYLDFLEFRFLAQVIVGSSGMNSQQIFGTTIHELAHASHWEIGYSTGQYIVNYIFNSATLPESWAVGVETILTRDVYNSPDYNDFYQHYTISRMSDGYTCIVEDLIDDHPQREIWGAYYPNDQVSGYTLRQLELALMIDPGNWWGWRNNIRDLFDNPTEQNLDALFQSFN